MANCELQKWICLTFGQNTADAETIWISRWPNTWFSLYTNKGISLGQAYDLRGRKILELRKPCYHGTIMPVICTHLHALYNKFLLNNIIQIILSELM